MKICGTNISDFKIKTIFREGVIVAEALLKNLILDMFGCDLPIHEGEMIDDEHYIVINNTSLSYGEYSIVWKNGSLYLNGSYKSVEGAVEELRRFFDASEEVLSLSDGELVNGSIGTPEIPYKNKDELFKIINFFYEDPRILSGQHLAGNVNFDWHVNDYVKAVGEGPSIMDIDFVAFWRRSEGELSRLLCQAVDYASKGGVIATMHHWFNPIRPEDQFRGTLDSVDDWEKVLTKGTKLNTEWQKELDVGGKMLKAFRDAGVSVIYRPLHEANGCWFWFCAWNEGWGTISSENMVKMWMYVYNYYTKDLGLDNLLWCYSPNISDDVDLLPMDYYYPGDDYCDIVGLDWYTWGKYEIDNPAKPWDVLMKHGKPTAICEFGFGGPLIRAKDPAKQSELFSCEDYLKIFERMASEGRKIAFAEFYADKFGAPSYVGKGEAFANSPIIVSLEEMPNLIAEILKN